MNDNYQQETLWVQPITEQEYRDIMVNSKSFSECHSNWRFCVDGSKVAYSVQCENKEQRVLPDFWFDLVEMAALLGKASQNWPNGWNEEWFKK